MSSYATSTTTIGVAVETTRGTPVAPTAWVKVMSPAYKPNLTYLTDESLQGSMVAVYDNTPGLRYDAHGWNSNCYMDLLPYYVLAELGSPDTVAAAPTSTTLASSATAQASSISTTATIAANSWIVIDTGGLLESHYTTAVSGAGPYTVTLQYPLIYSHASGATVTGLTGHTWSLLNNVTGTDQPPSITITDFNGEEWRQLSASQLDKLSFTIVPDKQTSVAVTWFANPSITPSSPSTSFSTARMAPGWTTQVSLGGSQITYVESFSLDLARGVKPIPAFQGTEGYYQYFAGPITATGKMTIIEQSGSPLLNDYLNGTEQALDVSFFDRKSGYGCRLHCSNADFTTGAITRSKEWVEVELDVQLLPTTTDATAGGVSPINISIGNAVTTAYD